MFIVITLLSILFVASTVLAANIQLKRFELQDEVADLKQRLETAEEEKQAMEMILPIIRRELDDLKQLKIEREMKIKSLVKFFNEGVFYDKENDTIVLAESLERVGDFE